MKREPERGPFLEIRVGELCTHLQVIEENGCQLKIELENKASSTEIYATIVPCFPFHLSLSLHQRLRSAPTARPPAPASARRLARPPAWRRSDPGGFRVMAPRSPSGRAEKLMGSSLWLISRGVLYAENTAQNRCGAWWPLMLSTSTYHSHLTGSLEANPNTQPAHSKLESWLGQKVPPGLKFPFSRW